MQKRRSIKKGFIWLIVFAALVYVFLYAPLIILMIFSFNTSSTQCLPIKGFTLYWYTKMLGNRVLKETLINSFVISIVTSLIATPLGLSSAYAVVRYNFRGRNFIFGSSIIPLIIPYLVTGLALANFFGLFKIKLSLLTGILGESLITLPFTFLICLTGLYGLDVTIEEAAMDLGANRLTTFFKVTLPMLRSALITSALFAFVMSFNEFYVAFYTLGPYNTLPIWMWSMWFHGVTPDLNAAGTVIVVSLLILSIILTKIVKIEEIVK